MIRQFVEICYENVTETSPPQFADRDGLKHKAPFRSMTNNTSLAAGQAAVADIPRVISLVQKDSMIRRIWLDSRLSNAEKLVGIILVNMTNDRLGNAWATMKTLEEASGISKKTLVTATAKLEATGWFRIVRSKDPKSAKNLKNHYFPVLSMIEERSGKVYDYLPKKDGSAPGRFKQDEAGASSLSNNNNDSMATTPSGLDATPASVVRNPAQKVDCNVRSVDFDVVQDRPGVTITPAAGVTITPAAGVITAPNTVKVSDTVKGNTVNRRELTPRTHKGSVPPIGEKEPLPAEAAAPGEPRHTRLPSAGRSSFPAFWPADALDRFLAEYPAFASRDERHARQQRMGAQRFLQRVAGTGSDFDTILAGARRYAADVKRLGTEVQFVAHPHNWLIGERWNDEIKTEEVREAA